MIRNKQTCLLIHLFMISFKITYKVTEIHIFIMKAMIQEQTAAEQQIAINNQLTAFRKNALLKTRNNQLRNIRIVYKEKQTE